MYISSTRGVPIIDIANISAFDMPIFTVSVIGQITKDADTSANISLAKLIFI